MDPTTFNESVINLIAIIEAPAKLVEPDRRDEVVTGLRASLKLLHDGAAACEPLGVKPLGPLPEMIVDKLDAESIWQELQLRDRPLLKWCRGTTSSILDGGRENFNILASDDVDGDNSNGEDDEEDDAQERTSEDEALSAEGSDGESNLKVGSGELASDEELVSSDDRSSTEDVEEESDNLDAAGDSSEEEGDEEEDNDDDEPVPTDGFFRWSAMENFADDLEKAQEIEEGVLQRKRSKQKATSSRGDLEAESSEEDEKDEVVEYLDDDDEDEDEDIGAMRYADFFDTPGSSNERAAKKVANKTKSEKLTDDNSKEKSATKHEMKQEKVKKRIQELEEAALGQKSWELKGEVAGKKRPENSLLEIDAEWDTLRTAAPDVAPERTLSLEDMIKQRVLDERWDSVMPKRSVQASVSEAPELSQEKSALGLGEVYEKDFLHRTLGVTVDEHAATRDEARALYAKVCRKLDALSNFSFTPRAAVPDMKVTPSVGAIAMEEVLPMGVSQADARAPSDVHTKKRGRDGLVRSNEETSKEERKRARGAKKTARRKERRADEAEAKLVSRINPGLGNPYEKRKLVESLRGARNVVTGDQVKLDTTRKTNESSAVFFGALDEEQKRSKQK